MAHLLPFGATVTVDGMISGIKLVAGVGLNDATYKTSQGERTGGKWRATWVCPFYVVWRSMLHRCYNPKSQKQPRNVTYIGCSVCDEWLTFSNFKAWMKTQDWDGKHLDKDILVPGNKVYSPETCVFVPAVLNAFLNDHGRARGESPLGVGWHKATGKYQARCWNPFEQSREVVGWFTDPVEAHEAWRKRKHEMACQYADMQTDPRIAQALRTRFAPQE